MIWDCPISKETEDEFLSTCDKSKMHCEDFNKTRPLTEQFGAYADRLSQLEDDSLQDTSAYLSPEENLVLKKSLKEFAHFIKQISYQ